MFLRVYILVDRLISQLFSIKLKSKFFPFSGNLTFLSRATFEVRIRIISCGQDSVVSSPRFSYS